MRTQVTRPAAEYRATAARARVAALTLCGLLLVLPAGAQQTVPPAARDSLAKALDALRAAPGGARLPSAGQFTFGDRTIAAGSRVAGPVAVANGTLHVRGTLEGDAVAYNGDVVVHPGGEVRGDAIAILGKVTLDGGRLAGDAVALGGDLSPFEAAAARAAGNAPAGVMRSLTLALGWLAVLMIVGIGVLVFASRNLDAVAAALERDFGRAFVAGIATQLALLPALALLVTALALTVLGILLIPFAIVAYVLAVAGLVTLGYLAIARVTGRTLLGAEAFDERARRVAALKALLYGVLVLMAPWLAAGALAFSPTAVVVARTIALAVTWVAATAGLGAAVVSRGGVRRAATPAAQQALGSAIWQTPTPVSGVVAARRPTPAHSSAQK